MKTKMEPAMLVGEIQELLRGLLAQGARLPKHLMLYVKNMIFFDGAIAHLAPDLNMFEEGTDLYVGGKIARFKLHKYAKPGRNLGRTMAFIDVEWRGNEFPAVCFFDSFELWGGYFEVDAPVIMKTTKTDRGSLSVVDVIRLDWLLDGKEQ